MKSEELNNEERDIVRYCVELHAPELKKKLEYLEQLVVDEINKIRGAIGAELAEKGFDENWEPNEYGLKLENLIGKLFNLYIVPKEKKKRFYFF